MNKGLSGRELVEVQYVIHVLHVKCFSFYPECPSICQQIGRMPPITTQIVGIVGKYKNTSLWAMKRHFWAMNLYFCT